MKTVIEAVSELKGELNGAAGVCYPEDSYLFYALDGSHYIFDECKDTDGVYQYVCTRKEFLATVAECETNFGKCNPINVSHYKLADKVLLTKDLDKELDVDIWENAPEGATHLSMGSENFPAYYYKLASDGLMMSNEYTDGWVHSCNANSWLINNDSLIAKPQPTPAYTQEMADNAVLPSVGMECIAVYGKSEAKVTVVHINNKKQFACIDDNGDYFIHYPKEDIDESFKPLTQPITLIDGKAYQFEARGNVFHGIYEKRIGSFNVMTGQFFNTISCTNIQPLTVGVK